MDESNGSWQLHGELYLHLFALEKQHYSITSAAVLIIMALISFYRDLRVVCLTNELSSVYANNPGNGWFE